MNIELFYYKDSYHCYETRYKIKQNIQTPLAKKIMLSTGIQ